MNAKTQPLPNTFEPFVSACSGDSQQKITKIQPTLKPAPEFDPDILPDALRAFVMDAAHRMAAPPDYIAITVMVALSFMVGRKFMIHPKQRDNWCVVPNLWGAIVGNPSWMKTPSMTEALRPVKRLDQIAKELYEEELENYRCDTEFYKLEFETGKNVAKKALKDGSREVAREAMKTAMGGTPGEPVRKRYIVNDATVEKLGELLNQNPNGLLLVRDELPGFLASMDKQGHESDRAFYLEAWSGSQGFAYDRIGRGTVDIENVIVSIIGGIQPAKIKPFVQDAVYSTRKDDGFLQRFQLMVYPEKGRPVYVDDYPDQGAINHAMNVFEAINFFEVKEPKKLRFTPDAQNLFVEWWNENKQKISQPSVIPAVESHLDKYSSMVPSLALIIALVDDGLKIESVGDKPLLKALAWAEYLEAHMHRVYSLADSIDQENAITIAKKFGRQLNETFTLRDITQANWQGINRDKRRAMDAIEVLLAHNHITEYERNTAGRPTIDYWINPEVVGLYE